MRRRIIIGHLFTITILTFCASASDASSRNSSELYEKGAAFSREGRYEEALPFFKEAVEKNPFYTLAHYGLGRVYLYDENSIGLSIYHLKKSVELDSGFAKGYFYLGMAYFLDRRYPAALHAFGSAFRNDRSIVEALFNIGVIYDITGNSERSNFYFEKYEKQRTADDFFLFR